MVTYVYTGTLTNIGLGALTSYAPLMWVHPTVEAYGPDGLISAAPVPVTLDPATGTFTMTLVPSGELTPARGGSPGVDYVIEVVLLKPTLDGGNSVAATDIWKFTAVAGGGNVGGMNGGSLLAVWIGPPWPAGAENPTTAPKGVYIDTTGDSPFGIVT